MEIKQITWVEAHFILFTSIIAISTTTGTILVLALMNAGKINLGMGIAMVGVITFCGTLIASSIFEEHRHDHRTNAVKKDTIVLDRHLPTDMRKKIEGIVEEEAKNITKELDKQKDKIIQEDITSVLEGFFAGKGIMRKAIASAIIITYIIIIGVYADNGELASPLVKENNSTNSAADTDPTKRVPKSLLDNFTIVVSIIIGFYFSTNILTKWLSGKSKKDDMVKKGLLKILDSADLSKIGISKKEEKDIRKFFEEKK